MHVKLGFCGLCNIRMPENHLAQVINRLRRLGFPHTQRGRSGGFRLAMPADEIRICEVFRNIEGEPSQVNCFADKDRSCPLISAGRLRDALFAAAQAFYATLDKITLEALICNNDALEAILATEVCAKNPSHAREEPALDARQEGARQTANPRSRLSVSRRV
ncbi:MAG: Rrf2 family transcriptional regulator [Pseudomonadota bacterium]